MFNYLHKIGNGIEARDDRRMRPSSLTCIVLSLPRSCPTLHNGAHCLAPNLAVTYKTLLHVNPFHLNPRLLQFFLYLTHLININIHFYVNINILEITI